MKVLQQPSRDDKVSESVQQKAAIALMAAAGRFRRQAVSVLDGRGISASQYNILRILSGADGVLPIMTIRDRMVDREPSITRLIDRLEGKGLVCRAPCEEDRRRVYCEITTEGRALLEDLAEIVDEADRRLMRDFTTAETETLCALLDRVAPES
jgi:MarR family transcriptional regulator, organic hydroperoxide resistance regulator